MQTQQYVANTRYIVKMIKNTSFILTVQHVDNTVVNKKRYEVKVNYHLIFKA